MNQKRIWIDVNHIPHNYDFADKITEFKTALKKIGIRLCINLCMTKYRRVSMHITDIPKIRSCGTHASLRTPHVNAMAEAMNDGAKPSSTRF